ncbi:uncharacterized protein LOC133304873 [Gastrolobium bilobum]|uniref:uncharacterized protein LOC133304873 n=1 Tax=Gastrolobium bilobum TaxID=150636 RepID=UPI002AB05982|nr:uncharacterized protein LOC133304873 [Gastrolobium bilobum]
MQGHVITWPFFEELFLGRYFPYDAQERKQGEFDRLVQGSLTVDEYLAKFNELVNKAKKAKLADVKGTGSSTSWKDRKFGRKGKGKQLSTRQVPSQFKTTSSQQGGFARPSSIPRCTGCEKEDLGRCATRELLCFKCGKSGRMTKDCHTSVARAAAVQAAPLQMILAQPTEAPVVPPATGRVYTLDKQQLDRAPHLARGIFHVGDTSVMCCLT